MQLKTFIITCKKCSELITIRAKNTSEVKFIFALNHYGNCDNLEMKKWMQQILHKIEFEAGTRFIKTIKEI